MSGTIIFDFPAIGVLFRKRALIRQAGTVKLVLNSDGLVPNALVKLFQQVSKKLIGREIPLVRLHILDFNDFGPDAVDAVETGTAKAMDDVINTVAAVGQCDSTSAARFVKRVLLEKVFVQQQIIKDVDSTGPDTIVVTDFDFADAYAGKAGVITETGLIVRTMLLLASVFAPFAILLNRLRTYPPCLGKIEKPGRTLAIQNVRFEHYGAPGELWRFKRSNASTDYVYDRAECSLFITDQWKPPAEILRGYKAHLDAAKVEYDEHTDFRTSPDVLLWQLGRALLIAVHSALWSRNWFYLLVSLRLGGCLYRERVHIDNLRAQSILCFDDYSERHIVRTWLARHTGTQTIGMAHSANNGLWATPQLAFILFDKYLIWNAFSRDLFADHWPPEMLVPYGYDRVDGVVAMDADPPLPPTEKKRILITLPGFNDYSEGCRVFPGLADLVSAINRLDDAVLGKIEILIRPKRPAGWDALSPEIAGDRVTPVIGDEHSTAEYMRAADLVISNDGSGVLSECAVLRIPVICFDFFQCEKDIWDRFGAQMYNAVADDLIQVFSRIASGKPLDVNFERVWDDLSFPYTADRTGQLRSIVEDTDHNAKTGTRTMIKDDA